MGRIDGLAVKRPDRFDLVLPTVINDEVMFCAPHKTFLFCSLCYDNEVAIYNKNHNNKGVHFMVELNLKTFTKISLNSEHYSVEDFNLNIKDKEFISFS